MNAEVKYTLGSMGGRVASHFSDPVLIRPPTEHDVEQASFRTEMSNRAGFIGSEAFGTVSSLPPESEILPLKKRPGGLFPNQIGVGRVGNVDVQIAHASVSKYHAFFAKADGVWHIADAGSKNGTFVDGSRLVPKKSVPLSNRARIRFGEVEVIFVRP